MTRILVAMSGGVDSSVTAATLASQGHDVVGAVMTHEMAAITSADALQAVPEESPGCGGRTDVRDAQAVADRLGIPLHVLDFHDGFEEIVEYFVDEYLAARTPNPCIRCNARLKFGRLLQLADSIGADYLATGHYARVVKDDAGRSRLFRGLDPSKDQSYVLFAIQPRSFDRIKFPIGEYRKDQIRAMATELGLTVADKAESQEICFIPDQNHARLIRERKPEVDASGEIVLVDGTVVGRHDGFFRYTIGQRKGLGVALGEPHYVVRIEPQTRHVVLGRVEDLSRESFTASAANWHTDPPTEPFECEVKVRYRSRPTQATVTPTDERHFQVRPSESCGAVTPGQAVVCYDGDMVLGGGWID